MNQIKLSLRAADDSRTIKEEGGVPTVAAVFALHNAAKKGETIPITVKASHELALTLVGDLRKGTAFIVEGQLSYFKHPDTNRESYSIWADNFTEIVHRGCIYLISKAIYPSKQVATLTGLSLLRQGSTKMAFGWKDCAHAQGSRTEVRIGCAIAVGDPNGIRTRVTAVKGRCPRPLDDRVSQRAAEDE
jgi:hypothetical protein